MPTLNELAQRIPKSPTIALADKAKQLKAQGVDVVSLAGGDPDFDTPSHVIEAAINAIHEGKTHYAAPSKGITPLVEAISTKLQDHNNVAVDPQNIVITPGGKLALYLAFKSILNPGDEVLLLAPYWVTYPASVIMNGGVPVTVELSANDNYAVTADKLRAHITDKTKAIIVNSPNNPSGRMMTQAEVDAIAEVAKEADLFVVADEIYEYINFDDRPHISIASMDGMADRTLIINGMSKGYAMTGWRLGWLAGPSDVMSIAGKFNSQTATSVATFTQHAAVAAYEGPQDNVLVMRDAYQKRRDFLMDCFAEMPNVECQQIEGAFYAFPKFNTSMTSEALAALVLEEGMVAGVPGSAFGITDTVHLRFSFATDMASLEKAMTRLNKIALKL